jgi:hypothetical protein
MVCMQAADYLVDKQTVDQSCRIIAERLLGDIASTNAAELKARNEQVCYVHR